MKNKYLLVISTLALFIASFLIGWMLVNKNIEEKNVFLSKEHSEIFLRDYAYRIGNENPKVYLIEFMDPECESCRAVHPEVKKILQEYKGEVQLVIRYAPFHANSKIAIRILEAARKQNKYEEVLDILFHYQPIWGDHHNPRPELIWSYLPSINGLDLNQLRQDMNSPEIEKIIAQDIEDGKKLEVRATPTFFVNGRPLLRFGMSHLRELIREEYSK